MKAYFEANPAAKKFYNMPPVFLNLMRELFNGILVIGNYIKSIDKAIESCIDFELLSAVTS